ncbi:BON domain-containing protein [Pseudomonas sp. ODNR1LW]|nr:BON domain-containing protein [Pseudomonas sp. ODNR1LW]
MRHTAVLACALLAGLAAVPAASVAENRTAVSTGAAPRLINLPRGTSFAVDLPADARDVIVSNPQVAEAMLHSPRRITVIGVAPGETDAVFLDAAGRTILSLRVRVDAGTSALQDTLTRLIPGGSIRAEAVNDSVILSGAAASPAQATQAAQVARAFVSAPEKVINMISVAGSDQVTLKVRVVEVQRSSLKQLGFSADILKGSGIHSYGFSRPNTYGINGTAAGGTGLCYSQNGGRTTNVTNSSSTTRNITSSDSVVDTVQTNLGDDLNFVRNTQTSGSGNSLSNVISSAASTVFQTMTGTNAVGCLEAFERVGLARTLAEPNLTSVNGEAANFLAGGEFPLPTGRDEDGNITVTYKPYGVGLAFRPVVLSEGRISLQVKVEVSELTDQGGFTIGAGTPSSITLPGLTVRRSENTVELPSGGSMMIAGLLQESTRQTVDSLPGVTNLPVLGALFRSRDFVNGETELVVIVEPYIVTPTSPDRMQTPADGLQIANDAQTMLFGQLSQKYGTPSTADVATSTPAWSGSVGYVIE